MRKLAPMIILAFSAGCSQPAERASDTSLSTDDSGTVVDHGGDDVSTSLDATSPDAGTPDARTPDATTPDAMAIEDDAAPSPFEFGFEPEPWDVPISGIQPATLTWDEVDVSGEFFLAVHAGEVTATLSLDHDEQQITYRLGGVFVPAGELRLSATERACLQGDSPCDGSDLPAELEDVSVYDTVGRYDGNRVVFSPFTLRDDVAEVPGFEFRAPGDVVMVPNDGFKPATVPDPVGTWEGRLSFLQSGTALTGARNCSLTIVEDGGRFDIAELSCDGESFTPDGDPGPDTTSLQIDDVDYLVEFDFVDDGARYRFGGQVGQDSIIGIVLDAEVADQLTSPFDANHTNIRGVFALDRAL